MITDSAKSFLTRPILLLASVILVLFWIIVLKPLMVKSVSAFIATESVSTRKTTLQSFTLMISVSSCSRMMSPLLMFQQHTLVSLLELFFKGFVGFLFVAALFA